DQSLELRTFCCLLKCNPNSLAMRAARAIAPSPHRPFPASARHSSPRHSSPRLPSPSLSSPCRSIRDLIFPMLKLKWSQAAAWRVHRHHIDKRANPGAMLEVARRLCGLHAQVMSSAELTVWARVHDLDRKAVQRALWEERSLVKTWAMRGTLHLLPSDELSLWHAALSTSPRFLRASAWEKYFGISIEELDRLTQAVGTALEGQLMTREELAKRVGKLMRSPRLGSKLAQGSWGTMLRPAAFAGNLCFGPSVGQRVRFTRPDTWLASEL